MSGDGAVRPIASFIGVPKDLSKNGKTILDAAQAKLTTDGFELLRVQEDDRGGAIMCRKDKYTFVVSLVSGRSLESGQQWIVKTGEMRGCLSLGRADPQTLRPLVTSLAEVLPRHCSSGHVSWHDDMNAAVNDPDGGCDSPT
jgi:hypothetical protein